MSPSGRRANWLAANLNGSFLTVWNMHDSSLCETRSVSLASASPQNLAQALRGMMGEDILPVRLGTCSLVPTQRVPAKLADLRLAPLDLDGLKIQALPALSQTAPAALMQEGIAALCGFVHLNPDWDGVICLPGPVTHWVQISAREVVSFQSALTSQMVCAAVQAAGLDSQPTTDWSALGDAAGDGIAKPELLAARLATTQAARLMGQINEDMAKARIWGVLLGAELAAARPYWLGQNVALIAADPLRRLYATLLAAQGLPFTDADPDRMTIVGLKQASKET